MLMTPKDICCRSETASSARTLDRAPKFNFQPSPHPLIHHVVIILTDYYEERVRVYFGCRVRDEWRRDWQKIMLKTQRKKSFAAASVVIAAAAAAAAAALLFRI